jgi:hypothetical protein
VATDKEKDFELRERIQIKAPDKLYAIEDFQGQAIEIENANGRELFQHLRHNVTNYDQVLDNLRAEQGHVSAWEQKQAVAGAAEKVLELHYKEHLRVVKNSQRRGQILRDLMHRTGVGTASALVSLLDSWSSKIKDIAKLENSQRTLQVWNDTYRVQRELVKQLLKDEAVSVAVQDKVDKIYGTRSVNKAVELGSALFNWERSEVIRLIKRVVNYTQLEK